jgi:hypothetical protein
MITNSHPEGRKAAQSLMDGMLLSAQLKSIAPEVVISANMSMLVWMAKHADDESRKNIAQGMRTALAFIENNQFPTEGTVLATSGALH